MLELTFEQIRNNLRQVFRELPMEGDKVQWLNAGFSSYVILMGDDLVLRVARHEEAMAGHRRERAILSSLQKYLPFQVPQWVCQAGPSEMFPFGVVGYRRIFGTPFSLSLASQVHLKGVAQDLARWLAIFHRVPPTDLEGLEPGVDPALEELWAEVWPILDRFLTPEEYSRIRLWWERYWQDLDRNRYLPRLVHGDPWGENIILNERLDAIAGLVDFEAVQIGDIAQDFAAQKYLGPDFLRQVVEHYQNLGGEVGNHFAARLQGCSMLRELRGLRYAIRYPQAGELPDALQKIRDELAYTNL